jgi:hypothetical protein
MKLDDLAIRYETDKSSLVHNYTERYETHFQSLRYETLRILEMGIQNGRSLKMWKDYFPYSKIFGLDINDCKIFDEPRITTIQGNQTDVKLLQSINERYGPFDIVIDDASHDSRAMLVSFDTLFPQLKMGGFYVVEDLHCCYWEEFTRGYSFMTKIKELLDLTNANGIVGNANIKTTLNDRMLKEHEINGRSLSYLESSLESVQLYRGIVFVKKIAFEFPSRKY